ncbi:hypothetical protein [Amycolatopsis sp. cmx-4-61]|uniref:hypothetical protein n=1 Tax=Amycolatopsis sp. cmx-4-61 TaxID=2790937 RepID=UPI003977EE4E
MTGPSFNAPSRQAATKIVEQKFGCRMGETARGAAYCFSDVGGKGSVLPDITQRVIDQYKWKSNPSQNFDPQWVERLWNTCAFLKSLPGGDKEPIFLVTKAEATGERYKNSNEPIGDCYTFAKISALPPDSKTMAKIQNSRDLDTGALYRLIYDWLAQQ